MKRVLVIGSGGAGKSVFSARLSAATGLPLIHLDAAYWKPGWIEPSKSEWSATVEHLLQSDRWIMDGNYGGTLERRIDACDTVILLDLSRWVCLARVIRRYLRFRGQSRPDMTPGCPERLSFRFLVWIWQYPARRKPAILDRLTQCDRDKNVIVLQSRQEVEQYLSGIERTTSPGTRDE